MSDTAFKTDSPKRPLYQKILVITALMSLIGGTLTGIMTYTNVGIRESLWSDWLSSFGVAVLVMPTGLLFMTLVTTFLQRIMPNASKALHQLITGLAIALLMESILAASTTANLLGFGNMAAFVGAWQHAFIAALPFGLFIALMMSFILKPKLENL